VKDRASTRAIVTTLLAVIVWYSFLVGHVLNNIRGFGS
jgi:diacylglycerol kinase